VREGAQSAPVTTPLAGAFNVSNLLGVIGALRALGVPLAEAARACADLPPVPGRMERVPGPHEASAPLVLVDYAHTPDALEKALAALRPLAARRGGKLCCVFGCGGNRDAGKRPLMGAAARTHADALVVTNDNPRGENPQTIIADILKGIADRVNITVEPDRASAIALAIENAQAADVVLIAGKGHEDYQEEHGQRRPFSDQACARQALVSRASQSIETEARP